MRIKLDFRLSGGRYELIEKVWQRYRSNRICDSLDRLLEALGKNGKQETGAMYFIQSGAAKGSISISKAKTKRRRKSAVLQDINGVKDLDACTQII